MKFTIDADSDLARAIQGNPDRDMTLHIVAHDSDYVDTEKLVTARLMRWTVRAGCQHTRETMELEWMDTAKFSQLRPISAIPE